jgi:hypothetical protein
MKRPPPAPGRASGSASRRTPITTLKELTRRDLLLLKVLHEHQVLTADQIARLSFPSLDRAQQRLRQLADRGVLDRFRAGIRPGSQSWRYTLGPIGAAIIAAERGRPAPRPAAHAERVLRLARSPRLEHLLGVNEFFIALAHHARHDPSLSLRWWLNEHRATDLCTGLARPDGFGTWSEQQPTGVREISFFLEYDTGTEPLRRLIDKLPGYAEARLGEGPDHPVLFWLPSPQRERHLHDLLSQTGPPVPVATATPTARADATAGPSTDHSPADRVWSIPGTNTRRHLIDLANDRPAHGTNTPWRAA